jgi:hypothetical protein
MPICEADPWRMQYFKDVICPDDVRIPTEDFDAYEWNPAHHWVYNKLLIAETQGLTCAPHGVVPRSFPVFSKPLINLRGMGAGSRVLASRAEYERHETGGHFWMTLLEGEHVSSDIAVERGHAVWFRHSRGIPSGQGTFDYWTVEAEPRTAMEGYCSAWVTRHLAGYTGMVNVETIGGRIIEVHLRFSDQWPDLYGADWLAAMVRLYARGEWVFNAGKVRTGYSVVLFGPHGMQYHFPPAERIQALSATPGVTSVQLTFHEHRRADSHAMPPGGFRLAVVNAWDLEAGRLVRAELAALFGFAVPAVAKLKERS